MRHFLILFFPIMVAAFGLTASMKEETPTTFELLLSGPNKTFRIDKVYDLDGKTIEVPINSTLVISQKGRIVNGVVMGNNTILSCKKGSIGVSLAGTWNVNTIRDDWFDTSFLTDDAILANISALQSEIIKQRIYLNKPRYECSVADGAVLRLSSNSELYLETTLQLQPTNQGNYSIISIRDKQNIFIKGGLLIGDVSNHIEPKNGSAGEWGMGIRVINSSNVTIENTIIKHCWGDGLYIGGNGEKRIGEYRSASKNVILKSVQCEDNRRQGMSIVQVDGLIVNNCSFSNTGKTKFTRPGAGVDIEPNISNRKNQSCRNISFVNCVFKENVGSSVIQYNSIHYNGVNSIENISFTRCSFDGTVLICVPSISFSSCKMKDLYIHVNGSNVKAIFNGCQIQSNNTEIRAKSPRNGYEGYIEIVMNNCDITLMDAERWIEQEKWNLIDHFQLSNCSIIIPQNVHDNTRTISNEVLSILRNSKLKYR